MKKSVIPFSLAIAMAAVTISCETETAPVVPAYQIDAQISNTNMDSAFLFSLGSEGWDLIDSTHVDSGHFQFTGSLTGASYFALGDKKRSYSIRVLADNSDINIIGDVEDPGNEKITGSKTHDAYLAIKDSLSVFEMQMESIISQYNMAEEAGDSVLMESFENDYYNFSDLKDKWLMDWVKANPKSYVAQFFIVNPIVYTASTEELRELLDNIAPEVAQGGLYESIKSRLTILENSSVGKIAPEFTMNDSNEVSQSLSSHFGTYLLVDFWASWCGPCRADNPKMVAIYNTYHDKGYNVLGVSLDAKRDRWMKAIADDQLTWAHVSDLKGWNNAAAKLYGVSSIPHTILLDPQGKIVARGLRGDELEEKLAELLSETAE